LYCIIKTFKGKEKLTMDKKKISRRFFIGSGLAGTLVALEGGKVLAKKKEEKFPVGMQKSETIKESVILLKFREIQKQYNFYNLQIFISILIAEIKI